MAQTILHKSFPPVNLVVRNAEGEVILRGRGSNVIQTRYCVDQPIDFEITLDNIDLWSQKIRCGPTGRGELGIIPDYHHAPVMFDEEAVMPSDTERFVLQSLAGMVRRKTISEAAYQQEKIRSFAELYGGNGQSILAEYDRRYPAIARWRKMAYGASSYMYDVGYLGEDFVGNNKRRVTRYFDLGDQW